MSRNTYARKARTFTISNPDADASAAQIKSINWLLRTRKHSVEFGNDAIDLLSGGMTRGDADGIIKHLAGCPMVRVSGSQPRRVAEKAIEQVRQAKPPVEAQIDWESIVKSGKLGKVAAKRAMAIA